jgi:hypothetical protein
LRLAFAAKARPDLARAILEKIDASSVFVGDVTPVGKGPALTADDGTQRDGKPLMNPNVAIELGCALARLTDARILMILNTAYGNREGLPFDSSIRADRYCTICPSEPGRTRSLPRTQGWSQS